MMDSLPTISPSMVLRSGNPPPSLRRRRHQVSTFASSFSVNTNHCRLPLLSSVFCVSYRRRRGAYICCRSSVQGEEEGPMQNGNPGQHAMASANMQAVGFIDFQTGATTAGSNSIGKKRNVHGVLTPLGIIIARYLKVFKSAGPA